MEKKQSISCTVSKCEYNDKETKKCNLENILVTPCKNNNNNNPEDESMCANYKATH